MMQRYVNGERAYCMFGIGMIYGCINMIKNAVKNSNIEWFKKHFFLNVIYSSDANLCSSLQTHMIHYVTFTTVGRVDHQVVRAGASELRRGPISIFIAFTK